MKIFITGGSGMVGRNILEHPKTEEHEIIAPARKDLDLLDRPSILNSLVNFKPDFVIHCAGRVGGIQANMANPVAFLRDNTDIGLNVIEASLKAGVTNFINLGSSCMYPRKAENPLREDEILKGELEPTNEGYALAKIVAAKFCEYIAKENDSKNYKTIIPCNLYGRHDHFDPDTSHLIPSVIRKLHDAKMDGRGVIDIWGDGSARREFMYAEDLADFIFFAIDNFERMPQNLNLGLGHDYSINEYYTAIASVIGYSGQFENDLSKPVGMRQKIVDITELKQFGWSHKTSLVNGIRQAYEFYIRGK
jgi:GDP-L-fucose synthase